MSGSDTQPQRGAWLACHGPRRATGLAIAECHAIDEAKDLRDKAMALRLYAKQAGNVEAERKACEVRLRAERRSGELLKELARTPPAEAGAIGGSARGKEALPPVGTASPYAAALLDNGISTQQASRMQRLADVPEEVFEAALADPALPTAADINGPFLGR